MKIEVNINKRTTFFALSLVLIFMGGYAVYAFGTGNPAVFGHSLGEIDWSGVINDTSLKVEGEVRAYTVSQSSNPSASTPRTVIAHDTDGYVNLNTTDTGETLDLRYNNQPALSVNNNKFVGIGTNNPLRQLHVLTPDRVLFQWNGVGNGADGPTFSLREGIQGWDIIKRGSAYVPSQGGFSTGNDLVISYYDGIGGINGYHEKLILADNGDIYFPDLAGTGPHICIDANGKLSRCA